MISTTQEFNQVASGTIRPIAQNTLISFTKQRSALLNWFTLDVSELDGIDILATEPDDVIQVWDAYDWQDFTNDVISMSWARSIAFPYGVQSATCDVVMNNTTQKYTYENEDSPIHGYILPKRPIRAYAGFKKNGTAETVPVFVGLTQRMPKYSGKNDSTATFTALDFLSEIGDTKLTNTILLRDVRTDVAIASILDNYGLDSSMYSLSKGLNIIPFADFESGADAGNILAKLVQAENGALWLDEKGIIRFAPRVADLGKTPVYTFDESNIIDISPSRTDGIYNRVRIKADIRAVQDNQPIFSVLNEDGYEHPEADDTYRLKANATTDIWLSFDNPIWSANSTPVLNGAQTDSSFTAVDLGGDAVTSNITVTGTLFSNSMKLTFTNLNPFQVSLSFLEIWGEPAKVVDTIDYDAYDEDSVEQFGEMTLEITDNEFFGSYANADSFAMDILRTRAGYSPTLTMKVKGNPALQLGDIIQVDYKYPDTYKIVGMQSSISNSSGLSTTMTVEKFTVMFPFILDESQLDGAEVLGG